MKRVRLFALLLASALFVSTIPVTGASAAQKVSEQESVIVKEDNQAAAKPAAVKLGWVKKGNSWYYVTNKGNHTGWAKINGRYYYFNNEGVMQTGFLKNNGKWYFFTTAGYMKTGWEKVKGKWYYFDPARGNMKTGWVKSDGHWYYLDPSGAMAHGWRKVDGKWYYLGDGGAMYKGPHVYKIDGVYYFFESSGALTTKTGIQISDMGNPFYTNSNGTVVTNKEINGKIINAEGIAVNKVNDVMDQKAQWYDSDTKYLVLANLSEHELRVYQGRKGEWTRIKGSWEFSCGAPATRTPTGQFKLCWKYETEYGWKRFEKCKAAYCYWTTAGFMLHTILYDKYSEGNPEYADIADDRLGMNISMSCIRLALKHARWIYTNIPHGTRLVVYE